jgi:hypothetical protein
MICSRATLVWTFRLNPRLSRECHATPYDSLTIVEFAATPARVAGRRTSRTLRCPPGGNAKGDTVTVDLGNGERTPLVWGLIDVVNAPNPRGTGVCWLLSPSDHQLMGHRAQPRLFMSRLR